MNIVKEIGNTEILMITVCRYMYMLTFIMFVYWYQIR